MPGDSCGAGWPGSMPMAGAAGAAGGAAGGAGGWQLPSSTKSLMLESPVSSSLSTRILLGRTACAVTVPTACAASGLAGPLVHRHFFQHVPPAHGTLGILACLLTTRGRTEPPLPLQDQPSRPLYGMRGTGWGPSVADRYSKQYGLLRLIVYKVSFKLQSLQFLFIYLEAVPAVLERTL